MKRFIILGSFFLLACGCGASADSLLTNQIKTMNDLADALEKKAPEARTTELQKRLEEITKKLETLQLSDADKRKLFDKHRDELMKASARLAQAGMSRAVADIVRMFSSQMPKGPDWGRIPAFPGASEP